MSWIKINQERACEYPLLWWTKPVGSKWQCPVCRKVWERKVNPDRLIGGTVFVLSDRIVSRVCRS